MRKGNRDQDGRSLRGYGSQVPVTVTEVEVICLQEGVGGEYVCPSRGRDRVDWGSTPTLVGGGRPDKSERVTYVSLGLGERSLVPDSEG